jgi:hypothetical protein
MAMNAKDDGGKRHPISQAEQSERFRQAARELGCDEDETAFRAKLAEIARQKPKAYEVTPEQRRAMEREAALERPARTLDDVRAELASATASLEAAHSAFDAYTGNNPDKHTKAIRGALATVKRLEAELASKAEHTKP